MNRRKFLAVAAPMVAAPYILTRRASAQAGSASPFPAPGADGWISLLNFRNLDGLYTFLAKSGKGAAETKGMVTFEDGMLHIMGNLVTDEPAEAGYIATNAEYENYRLRAEYKWGMKRFRPRLEAKRDNGLLYHLVGEDKVWPTCVECQVQEGDIGDYFLLGSARGTQGANSPVYTGTNNRILRDRGGDFENRDDWNVVEVIAQNDRSTHIVNGVTVNTVSNLQQADPQNNGQAIPLRRGKVAIELEYAEIWYRRFEIKPLG
ncbi:MAG TPA: DUF1080 domain-containing protein [Bryobacteraceae bacterium]